MTEPNLTEMTQQSPPPAARHCERCPNVLRTLIDLMRGQCESCRAERSARRGMLAARVNAGEPSTVPTAINARALRLNGRVAILAADTYYAEQDLMGATPIEQWSALGADQQRAYVKRLQAALMGGIGYAFTKARDRAVRRVSVARNVMGTFGETTGTRIEAMCGEAIGHLDAELVAEFKERIR